MPELESEVRESDVKRPNALFRGLQKLIGTYEETPSEILARSQKEATTLAKELEKREGGQRVLLLNLGWRSNQYFRPNASEHGRFTGFHFEGAHTDSGEALVSLYEQFKKLAPDERVAIAISDFQARKNSDLTTPVDVIKKIVEVSEANGWGPPQVVGVPSEKQKFDELKSSFPDIYLGDYTYEGRGYREIHDKIFKAIEQNLPPSTVKLNRDKSKEEIQAEYQAKRQREEEEADRKLTAYEVSIEPKMQEEAEEAFRELETLGGERGLIIVVDDYYRKIEAVSKQLREHAQQSGVNYVIKSFESGSDAIVFYLQFAQVAPNESVIILIDGNLKGILNRGIYVVNRLAKKVKQENLPMPFLVGESSDDRMNEDLQRMYPDVYLGSFYEEGRGTLETMKSKL